MRQSLGDQLLDFFMALCVMGVPLGFILGGMVSVEMAVIIPMACVTWYLLALIAKGVGK